MGLLQGNKFNPITLVMTGQSSQGLLSKLQDYYKTIQGQELLQPSPIQPNPLSFEQLPIEPLRQFIPRPKEPFNTFMQDVLDQAEKAPPPENRERPTPNLGDLRIPNGLFGQNTSLPATAPFRQGARENPDGSVSTHLMRREFVPNKGWMVFPTLFQNADGQWIDLGRIYRDNWQPILSFAEQRGEAFNFGNDVQSAIDFADKGIWKTGGKQ